MTDEQFEDIISKIDQLEDEMLSIRLSIKEIKSEEFLNRMQEIRSSFELDQERYLEIHRIGSDNAHRLNTMANELKGIVSMARGALKDRAKSDTIKSIKSMIESLESCKEINSPIP